MSIEFRKLNSRPGVSGSFGSRKTSGVSSQATKNLANASTANSTIKFSLKNTKKSGWVAGQNVSRGKNQFNYQGTRKALNGSFAPARTYSAPAVAETTTFTVNNNTAYQKGMIFGQILNGTFSLLNEFGVFDKLKGGDTVQQTSSQKLDSAMSSMGGISTASTVSSSSASSAIANMSGATDSASLRQAINGAETQLDTLSYVNTDKAQADYETTKSETTKLSNEVKAGEKDVKEKENAVGQANQQVEVATTKRDVAKKNLSSAMQKNTKCTQAYAEAKANLAAAQTAFENTPETITVTNLDGTTTTKPNPAKKEAQEALKQAEQAEQEAKKQLEMSEEEVKQMEENVSSAENNLKAEEKKLDNAKTKQTEAEESLKESKSQLDKKKSKQEEKEAALEKFESDKKDYEKLSKEITEQKQRLQELEEKEQEQFEKLGNKIETKTDKVLNRKIDASDGMSLVEKLRQKRNERAEDKIDKMSAERAELADNIAKTNILSDNTNVQISANGEELRSGTLPSGQKVYFVGTREVSQNEYENLIPKQ